MNANPLVSIIINNYNYSDYVAEAIESAIHQSYPFTEVIVVDDGSTDQSREIILQYKHEIIPLFKENGGQASAMNTGFKFSKGDVILFLDADDYLLPKAIEKAVEALRDGRTVKVHWLLHKIQNENKISNSTLPDNTLAEGNLKDQLIRMGPSHSGGPPHGPPNSGNAWARWYLEKIFPIPEPPFKGGADNYLFVLAPLFGEIRAIHEPLGYYRIHGKNNTLKEDYMTTFFARYDQCCQALSHYLSQEGIHIDPTTWPRDHWYHQVYSDMKELAGIVPASDSFVLVDENHWLSGDSILGRSRILFTERNGEYWGPPANDQAAILELERDRQKGASFIVFTSPAFWWLDYYSGFRDHLKECFPCMLNNDRMVVYKITN